MESIREVDDESSLSNDEFLDEQVDARPSISLPDDLQKMAVNIPDFPDLLWIGDHGNVDTITKSPVVARARKLLYRRFRVGVEDGRIFVGKFHCLDKQGNIILYDTVEYRQISQGSSEANAKAPSVEQRSLGLVLIPDHCRTSCFVECSPHEQESLLLHNEGLMMNEELSSFSMDG
ncbi:hypothetical protein R1flu_011115 [Riccia fluitans]|uniref:Sm domain-containing protein n=1 Tax=Riccia fluitans TaxID=41844 RepID=A0ABD1Z6X2_9MARC